MTNPIKEAIGICKILLRHGYDAHVINAPLQEQLLRDSKKPVVDIACEPDTDTLAKLIPGVQPTPGMRSEATLAEKDITFNFFRLEMEDSGHPELSLMRITPRMVDALPQARRLELRLSGFGMPPETGDAYEGFEQVQDGELRLAGLPDETLRHNYLLAIRALRFAANFDLPVEQNTWLAIVRSSTRVLDYVPIVDVMNEWRKVAAESLWKFVQLLYDAHILHGLIPEVAALSRVKQHRNDSGEVETVFEHTIKAMQHYPDQGFNHDWLGTMAMMFHDVGKLYTGEYFNGDWTFYQHHRAGAKVTRKILRRLHFLPEDVDLLCHLVRYHMRFHFMLTDRGIRRFKALEEYPRLIAMTRADIEARAGSYTSFNHNNKYLDRAETPEQMLEPLLNGNQIMEHTKLPPGPMVGTLRDALLQAQIAGEVSNIDEAVEFVRTYVHKHV